MRVRYLLFLALAIPVIVQIVRWFVVMITTLARGAGSRCHKCGSKRTRRSMPRPADMLLPAFIVPRRCENCKSRFFTLHSVSYVRRVKAVRSSTPLVPRSRSKPLPALTEIASRRSPF